MTLPNGHFYPPLPDLLFGPIWVPLGPYETVYDTLTHDIPSDAFLGNHVYNAAVGRHPWIIWNEDHFEFTITPAYSERR